MQRIVDKIKDSAPGSNMRSFSWLWEQFSDYLAELREDQNERDFREAMMKETARFDPKAAKEKAKQTTAAAAKANAAPAVPPPLPKKKQPPPSPPAKQEGDGKGEGKGKGKGKGKGRG